MSADHSRLESRRRERGAGVLETLLIYAISGFIVISSLKAIDVGLNKRLSDVADELNVSCGNGGGDGGDRAQQRCEYVDPNGSR